MNITNHYLKDGRLDWPEFAPYDAIHVGAAAAEIPSALKPLFAMFLLQAEKLNYKATDIEKMEMEMKNSNTEADFSVVESHVDSGLIHEHGVASAHTIGHDTWGQVGLLLVASFNCGYILSFSNLTLVPLGWAWGILCLCIVGLYSAYANWLLAGFHFINGQRFIRYRDIMGFLFGREMYYITWGFQSFTLLLGNMGFILLGGRALKAMNAEFSDSPLRLQYFIIITGVAYLIFAVLVPTMSAMGRWLAFCTFLTITYICILVVFVVKDGKSNSHRDYNVNGSKVDKVSNAFGAVTAMIVCNTGGLLLEIQSTLRKPAVENMRKALFTQYSVGLISYYGVIIVGYWAYGSAVSDYLPNNSNGPKWAKIVINAAVFLQSIVSQHMFVAPIHEALDTKFLKIEEKMHSRENIKRLIGVRTLFFTMNTFVAAALPFMGDFINLFGSFTLIPLTFVFPSMIFIKVKGKTAKSVNKLWHWTNIVLFSILAIATTASALRLLVKNISEYDFFADK